VSSTCITFRYRRLLLTTTHPSISLDFNLHQAILKSLATSFAGTDAKSAKATATGKAASTNGHIDVNGAADTSDALQQGYHDILDTFVLPPDLLEDKDNWTRCDANAVIALAEYAVETAKNAIIMHSAPQMMYNEDAHEDARSRLQDCSNSIRLALERLHMIKIERCLGGQGEHTAP
jgi:hypothetical protein